MPVSPVHISPHRYRTIVSRALYISLSLPLLIFYQTDFRKTEHYASLTDAWNSLYNGKHKVDKHSKSMSSFWRANGEKDFYGHEKAVVEGI